MIANLLFWSAFFSTAMTEMEVFYQWKTINYTNVPDDAFSDSYINKYVAENNLPNGAVHYNGRVFITVPRRRVGVLSTLNYIDVGKSVDKTGPLLKPYPHYEMNKIDALEPNTDRIVSILRSTVDKCGQLWFFDSGTYNSHSTNIQINKPSLWIIDLKTDKKVRRFEIANADDNGYASITVDSQGENCNDAYAYIPDLVRRVLSVYSFRENRMWTFKHNFFSFDPLLGDFNLNGIKFQWDDGIFSVALGKRQRDGFRTAYFHPMISNNEFTVNTRVLQNESLSLREYHSSDFSLLGYRGPNKQSTKHAFDEKTEIMVYAEIGRNGFGCWNSKLPFSETSHDSMGQDDEQIFYPTDISIDDNSIVWALTNSFPRWLYASLNYSEYNYKLWRSPIEVATAGTRCQLTHTVADITKLQQIMSLLEIDMEQDKNEDENSSLPPTPSRRLSSRRTSCSYSTNLHKTNRRVISKPKKNAKTCTVNPSTEKEIRKLYLNQKITKLKSTLLETIFEDEGEDDSNNEDASSQVRLVGSRKMKRCLTFTDGSHPTKTLVQKRRRRIQSVLSVKKTKKMSMDKFMEKLKAIRETNDTPTT
ncbi:L-dopachrome tautomerase yellow-f2 [Pseudolycoriella hygida]|uniref:L-dopachrome tautomerase yellow-f2 n=1 Tax=Pseudolycoriella hygida TaxID=35572 RepID=A0A9Q0MXE0_9DIPT|nr:L-dopachrome tautomerase yellow-f2 [Pseudolycoriella hygida]